MATVSGVCGSQSAVVARQHVSGRTVVHSLLDAYSAYLGRCGEQGVSTLAEFLGVHVASACSAVVAGEAGECGFGSLGLGSRVCAFSHSCKYCDSYSPSGLDSGRAVGEGLCVGLGSVRPVFGGTVSGSGSAAADLGVSSSDCVASGGVVEPCGDTSCSVVGGGTPASVQGQECRGPVEVEGVSSSRGSSYWRNKKKRENKKRKMQRDWRSSSDCQKEDARSDATVVTVDTKMAEEVQAKRSLAVRRTMENKVATALAAHKLRTLKDKSRTDAVERLAAARFEQRINEAKAKSQSSFKQCDQSLKSLGSSGSAGEFALKQEVKRAQDDRKLLDYVQKQLDIAIKCATPAAIAAINALPAPEFQDEFEAFGDCPSDYDEDEAQAYYNQLNARNQELADIANVGF